MLPLQFGPVRTVLCLGAHSDDIEIGCGGTLLRLLAERQGVRVCWVVFSAAGQRGEEARRSAEAYLADAAETQIVLEEFRDTLFPYQGEPIKECFSRLSKECTPDLIFTHRREDLHQDHRLLAELTWNAFRNHLILEYEIPKYEGDLGAPNFFVPLQQATCQRKVELLEQMFATQRSKGWFDADTFWALLRLRGVECQSPTRFAEAFHCRKLTI